MGLEIEAAAIAAQRRTEDACAMIQTCADAYEKSSRGDTSGVAEGVGTDLNFHRAICDATGNDYYRELFNYLGASLRETMLVGRLQAIKRGSESRDAVREHHQIAEAIAAGDAVLSRDRMRIHLEMSCDRLLENLGPKLEVLE